MHEYIAVMHVHTIHSDGHSDVEKIAKESRSAGVDIVFITDHGRNEVKKLGKEGWYEDVLILSGYELNDARNKNHYLVFDVDHCISADAGVKHYVCEVRKRGGIGFIAHPDENRHFFSEHPPYEWTNWEVGGFDGIEIWNYMSEWMEGLRPGKQLLNLFFPDRCIKGPTQKVLRYWDEVSKKRRVIAIGSADAHCYQHKLLWFTVSIFPYEKLFRRIRTHFLTLTELTGDCASDRKNVLETLRDGRVFISYLPAGNAKGFSFSARHGGENTWMGSEVAALDGPVFSIEVPLNGLITLLRDGSPEVVKEGNRVEYTPVQAGSYRVEVQRRGKPWIYSNAIRVV